jgi:hypothetical protein
MKLGKIARVSDSKGGSKGGWQNLDQAVPKPKGQNNKNLTLSSIRLNQGKSNY